MSVLCPQCGAEISGTRLPFRLTCPGCGLRFSNPAYGDLPPAADQVRGDSRGTGVALLLLGAMGLAGTLTLGLLPTTVLLVGVVGVATLVRAAGRSGTHPVIQVLIGAAAVAGTLVLIAVALLTYLFIQCSRGEIRWGG